MAKYTVNSSEYLGGNTVVEAVFEYGPTPYIETQKYVFEGELTKSEATAKLEEILQHYESQALSTKEKIDVLGLSDELEK